MARARRGSGVLGIRTASVPGVLGNFLLYGTVSKQRRLEQDNGKDLLLTSLRSEAPYLSLKSVSCSGPNRSLHPRQRSLRSVPRAWFTVWGKQGQAAPVDAKITASRSPLSSERIKCSSFGIQKLRRLSAHPPCSLPPTGLPTHPYWQFFSPR